MSSTKKAVKNISWLFSEKIMTMGISLFVSILLARYLEPESFGKMNYMLSFASLLVPFSALGLNALIVRELVNNKKEKNIVIGSSLGLRCLGGLSAVILTILGVLVFPNTTLIDDKWLIIVAICNSFTALYLFDFYFQSIVESKFIVKARLITITLSCFLKILFVLNSYELDNFLYLIALEPILTALLMTLFYKLKSEKVVGILKFESQYAKSLLSQSKWLILSGFMSIIYLKIDQLMLGEMIGATEVGVYSVAVRLSEVWYFFPTAIVASFFPKLLNCRDDQAKYKANLQSICDLLFWMALLLAILVSFMSNTIIYILFGEQYLAASDMLNIHIWAGVFIFMRALLSKWLIAESMLKFSLLTHGVAAVINVILNLAWIPDYGGIGAAWATFISYGASSYFVLFFSSKTRSFAFIMTKSLVAPFRYSKKLKMRREDSNEE